MLPVSSRTTTPVHSNEAPLSAKQIGALALSFFMAITPSLGAVGVALRMPVQAAPALSNNATCPPLQISPSVIREYLQSGSASHFSSRAYLELQEREFDSYYDRKEKVQLYSQATQDFQRQAEQEDHPAARAIAFRQARGVAQKAGWYLENSVDKIERLRIQAADACSEAAELEVDPQEKLRWAFRGLRELEVSISPQAESVCSEREARISNVASSLWSIASQALLQQAPVQLSSDLSIRLLSYDEIPSNEFYAARCLQNAAYCMRRSHCLGAEEMALADDVEAIRIMKSIDTTNFTLDESARLQDQILFATGAAYNNADSSPLRQELRGKVYIEAVVAQQIYSRDPLDIYFVIQRATRLEDAAYYSMSITQCIEHLTQARDLVQKAWDENPEDCRLIPEFTLESRYHNRRFTLEGSLLGRLNEKIQIAEQQLSEESAPFPVRAIRSVWNAVRNWTE